MELPTSSRRSFLKKTATLAVGISATTLFSGLTHAAIIRYSDGTSCQRQDLGGTVHVPCTSSVGNTYECTIDNADGDSINIVCASGSLEPETWVWCPLNDC
jgi:hypothetical protein